MRNETEDAFSCSEALERFVGELVVDLNASSAAEMDQNRLLGRFGQHRPVGKIATRELITLEG